VDKARAELDRAKARVQKAEAAVVVAQVATESQNAKLEAAIVAAQAAESTAKFQKQQLDRTRDQTKQKVVGQSVLDKAEESYQSALTLLKIARAEQLVVKGAVKEFQAAIDSAKSGLTEAMSELRIAHAGLRSAEITAGYSKIDAPFDGIVTRRNYQDGDLLRAPTAGNVNPILTVVQSGMMRVEFSVPEGDSSYVDPGDPVTIYIGALGPRGVFKGRIARTAYALDPKYRQLHAEVDLPNPDGRFRPGNMGQVVIDLESRENVLAIPTSALWNWNPAEGTAVCFRAVNGHAVRTALSVGENTAQRIEVLKGLNEGDAVLAYPGPDMRDGQAVTAKPDAPESRAQ
jgi:RND family efflux transporter MFP subunit